MSFRLLFQILKSRFYLVLLALVVTVGVTWQITNSLPKKYSATTGIVLNFRSAGPFGSSAIPAQFLSKYLATQVDIIQSHKVAKKVVENLNLVNSSQAKEALIGELEESDISGSIDHLLAKRALRSLVVTPSWDSLLLNITSITTSAELSALLSEAFAEAYIEATLELSTEPARRNAAWFNDQINTLRVELDEKQTELTLYQQEKGIFALDEKLDTETIRLEELSTDLIDAQQKTYDVRSRQLGQNHPEYSRAVEQEESLTRLYERQKSKVLNLKKQRDGLGVLVRDVEATQRNYDAALKAYYESNLESQFNQTNITVLSRAVPPVRPSSPNLTLNLLLAAFVGVIFGIAFALLMEMRDRRIRLEDEVPERLGIPVLATLS